MKTRNLISDDAAYLDARNTLKSLARWTEDKDLEEEGVEPALPEATADTSASELNAPRREDGVDFWPEKAWRDLVEALPDALVVIDKQGTICLVNAQTEAVFGYRRDELIGRLIEKLIPDRFRTGHVGKRDEYFTHPKSRPMGARLKLSGRRKDGSEFPVEISLSPLYTRQGVYATSVIRDITQRKRQEAKFETLVEHIPAVTFIAPLDDSAPELYVSPEIENMLGFSQKEWLEDPVLWHRQLHPEDRERWNCQFAPTCASGKPFKELYRFKSKKGKDVWVLGSASVVRDADGQPSFLQGVAFDITSIKEAEEERDRFFSLAIDLYCIAGLDGFFKRVNPAFSSTLGYSENELLSVPFLEFVHAEDREATQAEVVKLAGGGATVNFENRFRCKDGSYNWLQWTAAPYVNQQVIYAAARDITEQKHHEETLREESRLALLRAAVSNAATLGDSLPEMLHNCALALTQHLDVAFARIWTFNEQESALEMQASVGTYTHRNEPHGRVALGESKIGLIASRRQGLCTNNVLGDERIHDQEWARREGMVAFAGYPLLIENRLLGVLGMFSRKPFSQAVFQTLELLAAQISLGIERKGKEEMLRRSNEELEHRVEARTKELTHSLAELKDKTEELQQFAYQAAHDLKKPLAKLVNWPEKLAARYGGKGDETFDTWIKKTIEGAKRMRRLIVEGIEPYSDYLQQNKDTPSIDCGVIVAEACSDLQPDIEASGAEIVVRPLPAVSGNTKRLELLFENLISNAIKYRQVDRPLRIEIGAKNRRDGWHFWVRDNGMGIEARYHKKIFNIGERLHNESEISGNGYGLYICRRIVAGRGGRMRLRSTIGVGSTFFFTWPAAPPLS